MPFLRRFELDKANKFKSRPSFFQESHKPGSLFEEGQPVQAAEESCQTGLPFHDSPLKSYTKHCRNIKEVPSSWFPREGSTWPHLFQCRRGTRQCGQGYWTGKEKWEIDREQQELGSSRGKRIQGQRVTPAQAGTALPGSGAAPEHPNKAVWEHGGFRQVLWQRRKSQARAGPGKARQEEQKPRLKVPAMKPLRQAPGWDGLLTAQLWQEQGLE